MASSLDGSPRAERSLASPPGRSGLAGVLVIDKPAGLTSAQVVAEVRRRAGVARAGHTGTLDPLATGVLPVLVGDATKLATFLVADDKAYVAELELGVATDTLDATGVVVAEDRDAARRITAEALRAAVAALIGPSMQVPPMYSALRVGRRRLHQLARAGEVVERAPRPIVVHRAELVDFTPPRVRVEVACSKGTYVRSLVDDLGRSLGCGAHLTALRRTASGRFGIDQAVSLDALTPGTAVAALIQPADVLDLPRVVIPDDLVAAVRHARGPLVRPLVPEGSRFQLVTHDGALLAVISVEGERVAFERVLISAA
jgi:tRNA pseudouridine55 synthase